MSKTAINQFSTAAASNTDIGGININTGWAPGNVGQALRQLMAYLAQNNVGQAAWNSVEISNASGTTGAWLFNTDTASPSDLVLSQLNSGGTVIATPMTMTGAGVVQIGDLAVSGLPPGLSYGDIKASSLYAEVNGWRLCYGQTRPRTDPLWQWLLANPGVPWPWGNGDGATTYTMPDLRGRTLFGQDNQGGVAAGRITSAVSGITGTTLGAAGGDENFSAHNHSASSSASSAVSDPGHSHVENATNQNGTYGGPYVSGTNTSAETASAYSTASSTTGITVSTSVSTTVNSAGSGGSGNIPPAAIVTYLMYVGA